MGKIRVKLTKANKIEEIELEKYVEIVVSSEIYANWPEEAQKAQAIAARTYAMVNIETRKNKEFDVDDTSAYQKYDPKKINQNAVAAIRATDQQHLTYNNKLIQAVYCSANGGKTVSAKERWGNEIPYLIEQSDPYCTRPKNSHGVGLCQWGMFEMAKQGKTYKEILSFYYPDTVLVDPLKEIEDKKISIEKERKIEVPVFQKAKIYIGLSKTEIEIKESPTPAARTIAKIPRGTKVLGFSFIGVWDKITYLDDFGNFQTGYLRSTLIQRV